MLPRPRLLGALLLGGVLFTYGATSEVAWLFLFAYLIWAVAALSCAYALWNAAGVRGGLAVTAVEAGELSPVRDLPESLFRHGPLPAPIFEGDGLVFEFELRSEAGQRGPARLSAAIGADHLAAGTGLVPAGGWRAERRVGPVRRGPMVTSQVTLEAGDPLGFFRRRRPLEGGEIAAALPLFASLAPPVNVREMESVLTATRPGHGNEIYGVREYRSGDPLRRIHWKTSARRGELVVREFEPPGLRVVALLLEARPAPLVADQVARLAASEAWDCIRGGGRVTLWAPGREALPADAGRSLWTVLDWLARYPEHLPLDGGAPAPRANEAIGFSGSPGGEIGAELEALQGRGAAVRAWLVGDGEEGGSPTFPTRRAGLAWPL